MTRHWWIAALAAAGIGVTMACNDDKTPTVVPPETFSATLSGANERVNPVTTPATGTAKYTVNGTKISYTITFTGLTAAASAGHIHGPADAATNASVIVPFGNVPAGTSGTFTGEFTGTNTPNISFDSLLVMMRNGRAYTNVHTSTNPGGEIRGQITKP